MNQSNQKTTLRTLQVLLLTACVCLLAGCKTESVIPVEEREDIMDNTPTFTMPGEETLHEGTWLQWPHDYGWDSRHVARYESSWVEMTRALHTGEMVHLIVYNATEKSRVETLLTNEGLDMTQVDFYIMKTDDVWVRDNGPIFVFDETNALTITNWGFNGWGGKSDYINDNQIPNKVGDAIGVPVVDVAMVNEGGSIELDGRGTLMAKRSSILNNNRNPGWTQAEVEEYFTTYLGVTNFIWLEGVKGGDITDDHIDGTARFVNGNTIITYTPAESDPDEYAILSNATDVNGNLYDIVHLPITQNNVPGTGDLGIYINFYVGNEVVLVPNFNDPNDQAAMDVIQGLFPDKAVVGIEAAELAKDGGMVHCVTQQQPAE